jgi:hypothetical protein
MASKGAVSDNRYVVRAQEEEVVAPTAESGELSGELMRDQGMKAVRGHLAAGLVVALMLAVTACEDTAARDAAATAVAAQWLVLMDAADYHASWDTSSPLFQRSIGRDQWNENMTQVRAPLGAVVSRSLSTLDFSTEVPKAPKGRYITIEYDTSFDNRPGSAERVALAEEANEWKVSGYYIQ